MIQFLLIFVVANSVPHVICWVFGKMLDWRRRRRKPS